MSMIIACMALATTFSEFEGDAIGAVGWLPLSTIVRVISLLVAFVPLETATGAVGSTAPFLFIKAISGVATEALFFLTRAHVPTPPIEISILSILSMAAIRGLTDVREEEEEEQFAPP